MALQGNLSKFRLGDLLQTLTQNQTWGILKLRAGSERRDLVVSPYGVAILELTTVARSRLEQRLYHLGAIDRATLEHFRKRENQRKPLVELLQTLPKYPREALAGALESEAGEQLQLLIEWTEGDFEFVEGEAPAEVTEKVKPRETAGLVFDAARRLDERAAFGPRFPDPEERFVVDPAVEITAVSEDAKKVLAALDGTASLRAAADKSLGDFFSTAKVALDLEERKMVRRLEWKEYLGIAEKYSLKGDRWASGKVIDYLETWDTAGDERPLLDLATRRRNGGDDEGAARCHARAADCLRAAKKPEAAADCLAQAVALAPKVVEYRAKRAEVAREFNSENANHLYECLRDWLVTSADRNDTCPAEEIETEILGMIPADPNEEARVGRALGQVGRRDSGAQLLCRAAKRRLQSRGDDAQAAFEFHEALRFVKDFPDAVKGIAKLEGRRRGRRRAGAVVAVALLGLLGAVSVPIRNIFRDREQSQRIADAQEIANRGDLKEAIDLLEDVDQVFTNPELNSRAKSLRDSLVKKLDDRRLAEEAEKDGWVRAQYSQAADAIDRGDYLAACDLYEAILKSRYESNQIDLVAHRLRIIDRKLGAEQRRVDQLCKTIAPKTKNSGKSPVEIPEDAIQELGSLVSASRRESIKEMAERVKVDPLAKVLPVNDQASLKASLGRAIESFDRGAPVYEEAQRRVVESHELRELEAYLLEGRNAETEGNAHIALDAFKTLSDRYKGQGLRKYLDGRVAFWSSVVGGLDDYRRALDRGDPIGAQSALQRARALCPQVKVEAHTMVLDIETLPSGAEVALDGQRVGVSPVKTKIQNDRPAKIEVQLAGFDSAVVMTDASTAGKLRVMLSPTPAWVASIDATPSGAGVVRDRTWYVADRKGGIHAIDAEKGTVRWSKKVESLSGIAGNPEVSGSLVYVATLEGSLYAFDAATGQESWHFTLPSHLESGPVVVGDALALIGSNDVAYLVPNDAPEKFARVPLHAHATTPPVAGADSWCVGSSDGSVLCFERSGDLRWRAFGGPAVETLRSHKSAGWLVGSGTAFTALDPKTGAVQAATELPLSPVATVVTSEFRSWFASSDAIVDFDVQRWEAGPKVAVSTATIADFLVVEDGFAVATSSAVLSLDPRGALRWSRVSLTSPRIVRLTPNSLGIIDERGRASAIRVLP